MFHNHRSSKTPKLEDPLEGLSTPYTLLIPEPEHPKHLQHPKHPAHPHQPVTDDEPPHNSKTEDEQSWHLGKGPLTTRPSESLQEGRNPSVPYKWAKSCLRLKLWVPRGSCPIADPGALLNPGNCHITLFKTAAFGPAARPEGS